MRDRSGQPGKLSDQYGKTREDVRRRRRLDARARRGGRRNYRWEELETVVQLLEGLGQLNGELQCGLPREKSCIGTQLTRPWCPLQAQFLTGDPLGRLWPQPNIAAGSCHRITLLTVSGGASSSWKGELSSMSSQLPSYIFLSCFIFKQKFRAKLSLAVLIQATRTSSRAS